MLTRLEKLQDEFFRCSECNEIHDEVFVVHDREAARIWGAVIVDGNWVGQNILGQLWMELRSELERTKNETK